MPIQIPQNFGRGTLRQRLTKEPKPSFGVHEQRPRRQEFTHANRFSGKVPLQRLQALGRFRRQL